MSKILITGANGFIGSHLAHALLAQNHEITCLVRKTSRTDRLASLDIRLAYGDITDRDSLLGAIRGQDVVFQLAGCLWARQRSQFYRVNEQGIDNVASVCAQQATPPVLVMISSLAAVGPATAGRPLAETDPLAPVSYYGRSKLAGENAARRWANCVPTTIVRPPIVFGEGDPATREIFSPIARLGIHVVPGWRESRVSVIHADDLATLLMLAAQRGTRLVAEPDDPAASARGCYFAAAEEDLSYADFGRRIGAALGRRRTWVVRVGPLLTFTSAGVVSAVSRFLRHPGHFNIDKAREALAGSWICSPAAAIRDLGFAVGAPVSERLRQTAQWYRENGWL